MKSTLEGSSLLTVTVLITLISLFCIQIWRTTALAFETTVQKQTFEQSFSLTEGMLSWAIELCKNNFDKIYDHILLNPSGLDLEIKDWHVMTQLYTVGLHFKNKKKEKKQCMLLAVTSQTKNSKMALSCCLTRNYDKKKKYFYYKVSKWSLNKT